MIPQEINTGFKIEETLLWKENLPVEEIKISDIEYNLDIPYLEKKGTDDWNLSPRLLISTFDVETPHAKRVTKADLSFPIHIYLFKDKWIILDGVHRFTKAVMEGKTTIQVKKVSHEIALKCLRN
jgi:hypothetical protein